LDVDYATFENSHDSTQKVDDDVTLFEIKWKKSLEEEEFDGRTKINFLLNSTSRPEGCRRPKRRLWI